MSIQCDIILYKDNHVVLRATMGVNWACKDAEAAHNDIMRTLTDFIKAGKKFPQFDSIETWFGGKSVKTENYGATRKTGGLRGESFF